MGKKVQGLHAQSQRSNQGAIQPFTNTWTPLRMIVAAALAFSVFMFARSYMTLATAMEAERVEPQTHAALSGTVIFAVLTVVLVALAAVMLARFYMQRDKRRGREAMAVEAKSDFFSKMSHDVRTPLNAVIGLQALALDTDDMQTVKAYLRESQTASNYLLSIINDVLDMTRIESGKLTLSSMPFDLEELLSQIEPIAASMAAERNLRLAVDTGEPFETAYIGDAVRIKQVLMNLLNNAIKFTKEGKVTLCIRHAAKAGGQDGITIKVSDTGIGMSADFLQRIFKPFEQEHSDYTQQFVGSGLGLTIVHNLVTLMGGTIDVVSEPQRGTTFTIQLTLPRGEALRRKEAPATQEIPLLRRPPGADRRGQFGQSKNHRAAFKKKILYRCGYRL